MNRRDIPDPRLVLFSPSGEIQRASALIAQACEVADIASVILRTNDIEEREVLSRAEAFWAVTSKTGAVLLLEDRADLVEKTKADGAHLSNFPEQPALFKSLKPRYIAGAGGLASRHDAMTAGEAGADYVMFGDPAKGRRPSFEAIVERVAWWAEIFEVPCVAHAASIEEIPALVHAGADFIALDEAVWRSDAPIDALARAIAHLELERTG
jgi:thiamine-phosphate pyrophosphorylase